MRGGSAVGTHSLPVFLSLLALSRPLQPYDSVIGGASSTLGAAVCLAFATITFFTRFSVFLASGVYSTHAPLGQPLSASTLPFPSSRLDLPALLHDLPDGPSGMVWPRASPRPHCQAPATPPSKVLRPRCRLPHRWRRCPWSAASRSSQVATAAYPRGRTPAGTYATVSVCASP